MCEFFSSSEIISSFRSSPTALFDPPTPRAPRINPISGLPLGTMLMTLKGPILIQMCFSGFVPFKIVN